MTSSSNLTELVEGWCGENLPCKNIQLLHKEKRKEKMKSDKVQIYFYIPEIVEALYRKHFYFRQVTSYKDNFHMIGNRQDAGRFLNKLLLLFYLRLLFCYAYSYLDLYRETNYLIYYLLFIHDTWS